jgi:hypothetical protein
MAKELAEHEDDWVWGASKVKMTPRADKRP